MAVVIGLDFGTTHSGFAFAHRSDPDDVYIFTDWPGAPRAYCKTQTSLWYVPTEEGSFKLEDWSWSGSEKFVKASKAFESRKVASPLAEGDQKVGIFATSFKVMLGVEGKSKLFGKLEVERLVVDYLRSVSKFIIRHLKVKYGKGFSPSEVQWCLTVPAIWNDRAKENMKIYAEKAELVTGRFCDNPDASRHPLKIILEPEAASFCCQRQLREVLSFSPGNKFLVADIGGGTIDIVVHQAESSATDFTRKVHELTASCGSLGGGTYVDANFTKFLAEKIGCFEAFRQQNPEVIHKIMSWWLGPQGKSSFDGTGPKFLEIPAKLCKAWKQYDKEELGFPESSDYYDEIEISNEQMRSIFDSEVDKIIKLIEEKLCDISDIKYILLVGGFSESPYLFSKIKKHFQGAVQDVLSPPHPSAAVCQGAVALGIGTGLVLSRISKMWYGLKTVMNATADDPPAFTLVDPNGVVKCSYFAPFVEKGESVAENFSVTKSCVPICANQKRARIDLLVSRSNDAPKYAMDDRCEVLETYIMDINEDLHLGRARRVDVTIFFGRSSIEVTARRIGFGTNREPEKLYSVKFACTNQYT